MRSLERLIERILLACRWFLLVFYFGLAAALAVYAYKFAEQLYEAALHVDAMTESQTLLSMLGLIDSALVASLIVMVMLSGYENFVSRFDVDAGEAAVSSELSFIGKLDSGGLKLKVAASIVAISSIHLLQIFLNIEQYANDKIMMSAGLHFLFVISGLLLAVMDRLGRASH